MAKEEAAGSWAVESDGVTPQDNRAYGAEAYWDARFRTEERYEWLAEYEDFGSLLPLRAGAKILVVGNGSSNLAAKLHEQKFDVTASDYSRVLVEKMQASDDDVRWVRADFCALSDVFEAASFDVILDKAAMDALLTDEGDPWNPTQRTKDAVASLCREARAVLRPRGTLVQISFQQPHFRKRLMTDDLVLDDLKHVDKGLGYFMYVWRKEGPLG
mmetsp:Transcript_20150/g.64900  ORF Transcript_20150/g.64900 Transcript_20150/m.64900 type:complete len:215 (-) Transcript_20150:45-689(-)